MALCVAHIWERGDCCGATLFTRAGTTPSNKLKEPTEVTEWIECD
jgi:hypothetical protein